MTYKVMHKCYTDAECMSCCTVVWIWVHFRNGRMSAVAVVNTFADGAVLGLRATGAHTALTNALQTRL